MYLKEITLQGFKTFAAKTTLSFLPPHPQRQAITAIVGPNGSGKSNIADAMRWVLGEQSVKTLRGRATHDVIFSGSNGKTRAGFAEVTVTFGDVDTLEGMDASELSLTRRLYRDGESDYQINGQSVRLADIQMLLATANVGQKSYAVINQGQVDHILAASPEERKAFFDDATGVKPLQLKRHKATLKLERTRANLSQAELLLEEIAPRLRTLKRLVKRLGQREEIQAQLQQKQTAYYGTLWQDLRSELATTRTAAERKTAQVTQQAATLVTLREQFHAMEQEAPASAAPQPEQDIAGLQARYETLQESRNTLRQEQFELEKTLELAKAKAGAHWAPLTLTQIIDHVGRILSLARTVRERWTAGSVSDADLDALESASSGLVERLQKPAPTDHKPDPAILERLQALKTQDGRLVVELTTLKQRMNDTATAHKTERQELFALQRQLLEAQEVLRATEGELGGLNITLARLEAHREDLEREIKQAMGDAAELALNAPAHPNARSLYPEIQQLRHTMDLIGGIDDETVAEFNQTQERHDFLESQIADLMEALIHTEKIAKDLDASIRTTSAKSFKAIREQFTHFFKLLFQGGDASLEEVYASQLRAEEEEPSQTEQADTDRVEGIDIFATPPGKKLKSINLLSGGERALTSIALISAVMSTNPSPFVILDEVDAALDEANTVRFANIIKELSPHTQFILITHNRATMQAADALYGVSMQSDGVSRLLSVKLEDIDQSTTARR